jgi:hypothetical protein
VAAPGHEAALPPSFHAVFDLVIDCGAVLYILLHPNETGLISLGIYALYTMVYAVTFDLTVPARVKQAAPTVYPQ